MLASSIERQPHVCYVEPFCGAAHVFFVKKPSKIEVLNDLDGELMNFFRCAQTVPDATARAWAAMAHSRRLHGYMRRTEVDSLDPIQRAARFLYLVKRTFGGVIDRGFAYSKVSGGATTSIKKGSEIVRQAAERLDKTILESLDFRDVIGKYDGPDTLFYCDPPYLGSDAGYVHDLDEAGHRDLAELLKKTKGKWLLSVGDSPLMRSLYRAHRVRAFRAPQALKKRNRSTFGWLLVRNF